MEIIPNGMVSGESSFSLKWAQNLKHTVVTDDMFSDSPTEDHTIKVDKIGGYQYEYLEKADQYVSPETARIISLSILPV